MFEVWRIKNTHHADAEDMIGGYRDVKVLGRFTAPQRRKALSISMIVEVQVIDSVYMDIKKFMHKAYAIDRGDFDRRVDHTVDLPPICAQLAVAFSGTFS